jgi:hypothetical protein
LPRIAMAQPSLQKPAYEHSDLTASLLAALASGLAAFLLVTAFLLALFYRTTVHQPGVRLSSSPPPPRLQIDPAADLAALRR